MKLSIFAIIFCTLIIAGYSQADQDLTIQQEPQEVIPEPAAQPKQQNIPFTRNFQFNQQTVYLYRYEVGAIFAILSYLILYKRGKAVNAQIVEKFYEKTKLYIHKNFEHIGFTKLNGQDPFVSQSPNQIMFYATGRDHCDYLQINFTMRRRQDLLYNLIYQAIYPEKDLITIDIPIQIDHPIVFCLAHRKKVIGLTQKYLDLKKLTGSFDVKNLHNNFSVLGQSAEVIDSIIDNQTLKKIQDLSSLIVSLHYTDQKVFSEQTGHLRAVFYASPKNQDKYLAGLELLFTLVDRFYSLKVPTNYKNKAMKSREAFYATKQKQTLQKHKQQLKKKKEDKMRQQQARLRSLPADKQKKQDHKRAKKQINKSQKSKKVM